MKSINKDLIITVLLIVLALETVFFGDVLAKRTLAELQLRDLRVESDARNTEIAVLGERILNLEAALTFTGKASWYGSFEHGRPTSSGEIFDRNELTAAALWFFPRGTSWIVYRPDNGKSVTVRINDTIPVKHGRILDLSEAAARELDMIGRGVVMVRISPEL